MKLLQGLFITTFALSLAGCCGKTEEKSRWDDSNKNKPPSATATATATTKPTTPAATTAAPTAKPDDKKPDDKKPDDKKAECKKFGTGAVNKAFPDDNIDGFKRVYKADKEGYAEAEYTKGKEKVTMTITHAPEKKTEYASITDKVSGFPYKTFGKNKSNLFVKDCYLVSAASMELDEAKRKTWLTKTTVSALP